MAAPLFQSEGTMYPGAYLRDVDEAASVHATAHGDEVDEAFVDGSIPSTPVTEYRDVDDGPDGSHDILNHASGIRKDFANEISPDAQNPTERHKAEIKPKVEDGSEDEGVSSGGREASPTPLREVDIDERPKTKEDGDGDDRQCRICFSGPEEEDSLGRLISPCLCTGSMRYVHVNCINAWRGSGANAKAFMECPQCHHQYRLRRTLVSGLATSKPVILLLSALLFITLTLTAGHIMQLLLSRPSFSQRILNPSATRSIFDDDYYSYSGGTVIYVDGGGTLIWDIMIGAVQVAVSVMERLADSQRGWMESHQVWGPILFGSGVRFLLGLAVLGSMSFLSLLLSLSLFAPLQLVNGLRGAGILGNWGRRRQGGNGGSGSSLGQFMIFAIILIGAANTLIGVYRTVERWTQLCLKYVETQILEVNPEDRRREREKTRARREESWARRWVREGRWRRLNGWRELCFRGWLRVRLAITAVRDRWRAAWLMGEAGV